MLRPQMGFGPQNRVSLAQERFSFRARKDGGFPAFLVCSPCWRMVPGHGEMHKQHNQSRLYYFDNNATTRIAPEVLEAMLPFLTDHWGNPSSAYSFGHDVGRHLDQARSRVAELIGGEPRELIFTSCGTESNNTAIQSALLTRPGRRHMV